MRPGGRLAVCKYGRPADNEFFAFRGALGLGGVSLARLSEQDAVDQALERLGLGVAASGEVPAVMTMCDDQALAAALSSAGVVAADGGEAAWRRVAATAAPYRQADGGYRFENRLKYRIVAA